LTGSTVVEVEQWRKLELARLRKENAHLRVHRQKLERILALAVPVDGLAELERAVDADARLEEVLAWLPGIIGETP
jgi:hypothetical protein